MPYKRVGKNILHKKDGWKVKQKGKTIRSTKRAMRLLQGIEHGWSPTRGRSGKGRRG